MNNLNLVYDSWDGINKVPLQSNCEELYKDSFIMPVDSVITSLRLKNISRWQFDDIKKYPNKNFYYIITLMPNLIKEKLLNNESPVLPKVIEYWKLYNNFHIIFMNEQESESYQTFYLLNKWTIDLNLNQKQLWIANNNPLLSYYKKELNSNINVHSTRRLIGFTSTSLIHSVGEIDFKPEKEGFFLCHNKRPRPHRYGLLCLLKKYNILNDVDWSLVNGWLFDKYNYKNFYTDIFSENDIGMLSDEIEYFKDIDQKKSKYEEEYTWFDNREPNVNINWNITYEKKTYENSYFNISTETDFGSDLIHITEKTFKPFYTLQFPLILASYNHVKEFKKMYNFDLFDDVINHDYDDIENNRDRLFRFFDEIKRIYNNKKFFIDFYKNNKNRFIENKNKLIEKSDYDYDKNFLISLIDK